MGRRVTSLRRRTLGWGRRAARCGSRSSYRTAAQCPGGCIGPVLSSTTMLECCGCCFLGGRNFGTPRLRERQPQDSRRRRDKEHTPRRTVGRSPIGQPPRDTTSPQRESGEPVLKLTHEGQIRPARRWSFLKSSARLSNARPASVPRLPDTSRTGCRGVSFPWGWAVVSDVESPRAYCGHDEHRLPRAPRPLWESMP